MSRVLRIELRRSAALGTALILMVIGSVLIYFVEGIMFGDGWMQLAMTQRLYLALLWPLAVAAGAWQARREHRSNVAELFTSTPRPQGQRVVPTLIAMAVAVVTGYLAMGVAGGVWIAGDAEYLPVSVLAVTAVGALALIAAVWLGLALGRLIPSPVTAPVAGVAGLALLLSIPFLTRPHGWLATVFSPLNQMNMPGPWTTVPGQVSLSQAAWMAGLAVTAVLLLGSVSRPGRVAAMVPLLVGAALAIVVMPRDNRSVYDSVDPVARALVCTEDAPKVCVSRVHSGLLPDVAARAREGLAALAKLPDAPTEVHEDTSTYPDDGIPVRRAEVVLVRVVVAPDGGLGDESSTAEVVAGAFDSPVDCEKSAGPVDRLAAAAWLTGREPAAAKSSSPLSANAYDAGIITEAVQRWRDLQQLPGNEALDRVAALRRAAQDCSVAEGMLTGGKP
jgi:hypothetical protein